MIQNNTWTLPIGAQPDAGGVRFRVWAADAEHIEVVLYDDQREVGTISLAREDRGYFAGYARDLSAGARYLYRIDNHDPRPDPASRYQPAGVHGVSQVIDPAAFEWTDHDWRGLPLQDLVIYELHVGTATEAGSFDALVERLDYLRDLGVTAIELMPVADFPGERNWGYDGVCLFAPARSYGEPDALRRLIDAAHARGLAVVLDVVYNHLGPDGNYLREFSKDYFTDLHQTPWGDALNLDGPNNRPVRDFFIANACYWAHEFHADGLRLDATHALRDASARHLLAELATAVRVTLPAERQFVLIAEDERNNPSLLRPALEEVRGQMADGRGQQSELQASNPESAPASSAGHGAFNAQRSQGDGLDAVWADDFHHQVHVALTGEREGYYIDFSGSASDLAATLEQGWFYTGQQSIYAEHARGGPTAGIPMPRFVHCLQNHDQVGNRALGERLNQLATPEAYRAATALLLLSPYTPLLFMGQEWAASTPFLYFTDHNEALGKLVTAGRQSEFARFAAFSGDEAPDPQARATFRRSKLRWDEREQALHAGILQLHRELLAMRRDLPALRERGRASFAVAALSESALALRRAGQNPAAALLLVVNLRGALRLDFAAQPITAAPAGQRWAAALDTEDSRYGGRGAADIANAQVALHGPEAIVFTSSSD